MKKAVAERLNHMSPQALLKYPPEGRQLRQSDALILAYPKAPDRERAWYTTTSSEEKRRPLWPGPLCKG